MGESTAARAGALASDWYHLGRLRSLAGAVGGHRPRDPRRGPRLRAGPPGRVSPCWSSDPRRWTRAPWRASEPTHGVPTRTSGQRADDRRRGQPLGRVDGGGVLRPHGQPRRDGRGRGGEPLPGAHDVQGHRRGGRPWTSTATSTAWAPSTTPSPARRTPSTTGPCCGSSRRTCSTCWATSCGPALRRRTSTWRSTSSWTRSPATRTSRASALYVKLMAEHFAGHPLGNSVLGTQESIAALDAAGHAGLLRAPLQPGQHHRGGRGQPGLAGSGGQDRRRSAPPGSPTRWARELPPRPARGAARSIVDAKLTRQHVG